MIQRNLSISPGFPTAAVNPSLFEEPSWLAHGPAASRDGGRARSSDFPFRDSLNEREVGKKRKLGLGTLWVQGLRVQGFVVFVVLGFTVWGLLGQSQVAMETGLI